MGFDMTVRYPWGETCAVLDEISRLRDDAIDTITREHMLADDEMADASVDDVSVKPALRAKLVKDGVVPQIVDVVFPSFIMDNGLAHAPFKLAVLPASIRATRPWMEITAENLNFLYTLAHSRSIEFVRRTRDRVETSCELPELREQNTKWRRRGKLPASIVCDWRDDQGRWHTHSTQPAQFHDRDMFLAAVRDADAQCQKFFDDHHCELEQGEGDA